MTGGSYDISIWWRNTMISMSLSVAVRQEDRSRPRIRHRPRQQRVKATADRDRWRRTLPAQSSDRGFGALQAGGSSPPESRNVTRWPGGGGYYGSWRVLFWVGECDTYPSIWMAAGPSKTVGPPRR